MIFLCEAHPHFNHLNGTVVQGLKNLGHQVYGFGGNGNSYLTPHRGETCDVFIQMLPDGPPRGPVNVILLGEDAGKGFCVHQDMLKQTGFDMAFVRELVDTRCERVYPIQFGIEDRYYCHTLREPLPLDKRRTHITFLGQPDTQERIQYVRMIREEFRKYKLDVGGRRFNNPDQKWSLTVNGFCVHDPGYFKALATSKINLSFAGWGCDTARHYECLSSGGIVVIERLPYNIPHLEENVNCLMFSGVDELRELLITVLNDPLAYQELATRGFSDGKQFHTTAARAADILFKLQEIL